MRAAYIGPHFGEVPPISGKRGSGTVFFSGCTLRCAFCQNYQISHEGMGTSFSLEQLMGKVERMVLRHGVHNINFVTPDHFFPHVFRLVELLRTKAVHLPVVYNLSGYQSTDMLKMAEEYVDIYLPDFKYADAALGRRLSRCANYPEIALGAIAEMVRQKGLLDAFKTGAPLARKGVLVRHLILPGQVENSIRALTALYVEFGRRLPLSLMSQYYPAVAQMDEAMNRFLSKEEFDAVYSHALDLGFENLFVQFPAVEARGASGKTPFVPDFMNAEPFK